jgi:ATP-dependent Lon protease
MIQHILHGDNQFGIVWDGGETQAEMLTGCLLEVEAVGSIDGSSLSLVAEGKQRFSVLERIEGKAYPQAKVRLLDEPPADARAAAHAEELRYVLRDIFRLRAKLSDSENEIPEMPETPSDMSFWIAANFYESQTEQQALLETDSLLERLRSEIPVLNKSRQYLAAKTALKDAFASA